MQRHGFIKSFSNDSKEHQRPLFNNQDSLSFGQSKDNNRSPLRYPFLDHDSHILIASAVLIPIIFTLILCIIVCCIYRHNKRRSQRDINSSIKPINHQPDMGVPPIYFNPNYKPFTLEEPPPSYDLLSKTKNDSLDAKINNNTHCKSTCCSGTPTSPQTACCYSISWRFIVPVIIIVSLCAIAFCSLCSRPFLKLCGSGCKLPFGRQSRVIRSCPTSVNNNPVYAINNDDLPDYETISKDSLGKDTTPPPYNFVAAHPTDFGIDTDAPSAPPQYRPRSSTVATIEPNAPI
ncbi:unnamed protein product [Rotaria sp. Silwood1]|nr:unnamed protein product [Rotaria sp. Silwood1]CAF3717094.1 unnamed protein product [Rotaria sp. Silwood1]CAF4494926.1 unnamed protein product [Rotaria sp. Silwood1]